MNRPGYVYIIKAENGPYKVGRSTHPESRLRALASGLWFSLILICAIPAPDMVALEAELHKRFAGRRIAGEWFNLTNEDVAYCQTLVHNPPGATYIYHPAFNQYWEQLNALMHEADD